MERSEALDIVRKNWPDSGYSQLRETLQTLIPELKESEDERIRKGLIEHLKELKEQSVEGSHLKRPEHYDAWIAWLEKQSEHVKFLESIQIGDEVTRNPDGVLVNLSQLNRVAKQGEQNLANSVKTCKVEPKFHIEKEQWYVCIQSFTLNGNIVVAKGRTYKSREDNAISGEDARLFIDKHDGDASKYFRPWTIQDAKDGDVLVYEGEIFIIKSCSLWNKIVYHCCYDGKILHKHSIYDSWGREDFNKVHPATKEQRDLLFQKMKEAGYEWDAKKKELKKIGLKPAWSEDDIVLISRVISIVKWAAYSDHSHPILNDEGATELVDWLKSLKEKVQSRQDLHPRYIEGKGIYVPIIDVVLNMQDEPREMTWDEAKDIALSKDKIMDEADKRKQALQNERELNPGAFTKEVSADNQALLDAAKHYSERTRFHWPNQIQPTYDAFIAGAQWQKEQDQQTIELAEEHALLAGMMQERERMMKNAIEGWVARDECGDIAIFSDKPHRDLELGMWTPARHAFLFPRKDEYPDVTWDSEPQKVKVIIIKE